MMGSAILGIVRSICAAWDHGDFSPDEIVHLKAYVHREGALRDIGVSEDALEPIEP